MSAPELHIGEVIASNTTQFSAVVPSLFSEQTALPIQLGSLVKTESGAVSIFALVSFIEHLPTEANRKVSPHGKTKAELREEMPQVFELLQTEFTALALGYETAGKLFQSTPPVPPNLHDFVFPASESDARRFFSKPTFLRALFQHADAAPDNLIVAMLRRYRTLFSLQELVALGKELSYLLADDHRRLEFILEPFLFD
ncbi:MAG: hypothetical protein HY22_09880 [[Candidatus Thermochlorobacteriaceae] bacterium GBChlB]|nr:MAG: hypothetical protein HY22_09880 [[Candidatus Thermochlorobacteriaceae] bacterium GBChlB]